MHTGAEGKPSRDRQRNRQENARAKRSREPLVPVTVCHGERKTDREERLEAF
jgi:hypothetical protein